MKDEDSSQGGWDGVRGTFQKQGRSCIKLKEAKSRACLGNLRGLGDPEADPGRDQAGGAGPAEGDGLEPVGSKGK